MKARIVALMAISTMVSCSSAPKRVVLDRSGDSKPSWVDSNKLAWDEGGQVFLKATHTVRGNERPNGCVDLAKLDAKENLLSEIKNDLKGSIDNAQQSISVDSEVILGKVRSSEFKGSLSGLRFEEMYWEKYQVVDEQSVTCHVLAKMSASDYVAAKRAIINKAIEIDPRVREAITAKQEEFFRKPSAASANAE